MSDGQILLLADFLLIVHFLVAAFITFGLPIIWIGRWLGWRFVHNPWFRFSHAGLMGVVLVESLLGWLCPLTIWETALRRAAGDGGPADGHGFVAYWAGRLLFHDFEVATFTMAYTLFFAAVVATFWLVPVRRQSKDTEKSSS